jgi:hypothetical protein
MKYLVPFALLAAMPATAQVRDMNTCMNGTFAAMIISHQEAERRCTCFVQDLKTRMGDTEYAHPVRETERSEPERVRLLTMVQVATMLARQACHIPSVVP